MCERTYTATSIATLQTIAAGPTFLDLCGEVGHAIAAMPKHKHRQMLGRLLLVLAVAGVDADLIDLLECALEEVG